MEDAKSDLHQALSLTRMRADSSKSSLRWENVFLLWTLFCPVSLEPQHPKKLNPSIMCNDCKVLAEASRNDKGLLHLHQYFSLSFPLGPDFY